MKKSYFLMAAAAALFAACAETDFVNEAAVVEGNAPQAIGFETFSNKATRHSTSTALNDYHANFSVFAWEDGSVLMDNYKVLSSDYNYAGQTGKGAQELKYWDNEAVYQFHAVAPFNANVTCTDAGVVTIPAGANATAATENLQANINTTLNTGVFETNTDWLKASAAANYEMSDGTTVPLSFSHMMSKLVVAVKKQGTEKVEITSIKVKGNIYSEATFNGTTWSGTSPVDLSGRVGLLDQVNTPFYVMEYLIVPTDAANLKLDIVYKVND